MSPYFACAYFSQAYFDTDCAPVGGGHGPRIAVTAPRVDDELLALI